jgi:ribonuclease P protein component
MLCKKNRLKRKSDFENILKNGRSARADFLSIKFIGNKLPDSRFGFIVSKKVSNKATRRNLIKRRLRNSVRLKIGAIKTGFDVIFLAAPEIKNKKYKEIDEAIGKTLISAGLLE